MAESGSDVDGLLGGLFEDSPRSRKGSPKATLPAASPRRSQGSAGDQDLFDDFNSEEENTPASQESRGKKRKKSDKEKAPQPEKASKTKSDASRFFEIEAEEVGGGSADEDEGEIEGLIDDSELPAGKGKFKMRAAMQKAANMELDSLQRDMESRGSETGARRVFGSSFLDRLQERYQEAEETMQAVQTTVIEHKPLAARMPQAVGPVPELKEVQERAERAVFADDGLEEEDDIRIPQAPAYGGQLGLIKEQSREKHIVPAEQDPKMWRCKSYADEKSLCMALINKAGNWFAQRKEVPIFSVFFSAHQRGYIYIEAFREAVVREFVKGIRGISPWGIVVVPVTQMPQVFTSCLTDASFQASVKVGDWVRFRRKPYTGDLAMIVEIRDDVYELKMKPRVVLQYKGTEALKDKDSRDSRKRPAAKWFNKTDLEAAGIMVSVTIKATAQGNFHYYTIGDDIFRDGFIYKTVKITAIERGDQVRPQEHELQDWQLAPAVTEETRPREDLERHEDDRKMMPPPTFIPMKALRAPAEPFIEGDIVIVNSGELVNLRGRIVKVMFGVKTVTVRPMDVGLTQDLELSQETISKYFEIGDYAKVCAGQHKGEAGYIMKVNHTDVPDWNQDAKASILSSNLASEFEVRIDQLQLTSEKSEQAIEYGDFKVGQMVGLQGNVGSRGVIIRIEVTAGGGMASVLVPTGGKVFVSIQELIPVTLDSRARRKHFTLDRRENVITPGCIVKAPRGQTKAAPVRASVLYIHNEICFLKAEEALTGERAYLVCTGRKVEKIYDRKATDDLGKQSKRPEKQELTPEAQQIQGAMEMSSNVPVSEMSSETDWMQEWFKKLMGIQDQGQTTSVSQAGAPVRILGGAYKGLRAEVRATLGDKVLVSLLCKPKLVTISMQYIAPDDYSNNPKRLKRRAELEAPAPVTPASDQKQILPDAQSNLNNEIDDGADPLTLNDDNCWDPNYLVGEEKALTNLPIIGGTDGGMTLNLEEEDAPLFGATKAISDKPSPSPIGKSVPSSPIGKPVPPSPAGSNFSVASSATKRRKRKSTLPDEELVGKGPSTPRTGDLPIGASAPPKNIGNVTPIGTPRTPRSVGNVTPIGASTPIGAGNTTPIGAASATPIGGGNVTPRADPKRTPPLGPAAPPMQAAAVPSRRPEKSWLVPGVGVELQGADARRGWAIEVMDGGARIKVVPESADVGNESGMFEISGRDVVPWICDSRGDVICVVGTRKGTRGKVVGTERNVAYVRLESRSKNRTSLSFASVSCKDLLTVEKQDFAKYSPAWVKAHDENLRRPPQEQFLLPSETKISDEEEIIKNDVAEIKMSDGEEDSKMDNVREDESETFTEVKEGFSKVKPSDGENTPSNAVGVNRADDVGGPATPASCGDRTPVPDVHEPFNSQQEVKTPTATTFEAEKTELPSVAKTELSEIKQPSSFKPEVSTEPKETTVSTDGMQNAGEGSPFVPKDSPSEWS